MSMSFILNQQVTGTTLMQIQRLSGQTSISYLNKLINIKI
jgi:hypothetical protein